MDQVEGPEERSESRAWTTDLAFSLIAVGAGLVGVLVGASGPLAGCVVAVGFVCGPTWGGVLLGLAIVSTVVTGLLALRFRWAAWIFVPSLTLAIGIVLGTRVAP